MTRSASNVAAEAETAAISKPSGGGVQIRAGNVRWIVPTSQLLSAVLAAALVAWGMVQNERADLRAADKANAEAISTATVQISECKSQLATEQVILAEIRTQLSRIDARVAEVQVTLMRSGGGR